MPWMSQSLEMEKVCFTASVDRSSLRIAFCSQAGRARGKTATRRGEKETASEKGGAAPRGEQKGQAWGWECGWVCSEQRARHHRCCDVGEAGGRPRRRRVDEHVAEGVARNPGRAAAVVCERKERGSLSPGHIYTRRRGRLGFLSGFLGAPVRACQPARRCSQS